MHIVYICREFPPSLRGGGIASYLREISIGMRHAGHRVTVVCASDDTRRESDTTDEYGVRVIRLKGGDFLIPQVEGHHIVKKLRPLYRFWSYRKRIWECVKQLKDVDVIEVAEYGAEGLYLHKLKIPVVLRLHTPMLLDHLLVSKVSLSRSNLPYYYQGLKEIGEMRSAKYCTSCSTSLSEWGVRYAGMQSGVTKVIYNPVNATAIVDDSPKALKKGNGLNILFAGTICDWKGCGDLAEAGYELEKRTPFTISFIGKKGGYAEQLKKKYADEAWFQLVGKIPREELQERFREADVVVFPSWWENMPMVCIEAMLQGAIVIGSNNGGMSEIITDGVDGFLVKPHRPDLLAEKIEQVAKMTEEEKVRMSLAAQQRIRKAFSTEVIVQQTLDYYRYVIEDYNNMNV